MPIPDYQSLMLPVLRVTRDQQEHSLAGIREQVANQIQLSPEEESQRLASGSQTVYSNRIAWAVQYLKAAGAIEPVKRSVYKITERGLRLLESNPGGVTVRVLAQFPEFTEFHGNVAPDAGMAAGSPPSPTSEDTPEESVNRNFQIQRDALAMELLEAVRNGTPDAFEKLVVDLLVAMGYGGSVEDAGRVVGRSGDGGIDGVIKQDRLGIDAIFVQAKLWRDAVGSPEIMRFSGALTKKHASRGVFITSSGFTRDALEYVEAIPQKIVLIDGKQLASLMIDYNVGVAPAKTYVLKRLDQAYFENL